MFVCDKCKKKLIGNDDHSILVNGKYYDICDDCYADLKELRDNMVAEFFGEGDEDGREG